MKNHVTSALQVFEDWLVELRRHADEDTSQLRHFLAARISRGL